MGNHGRVNLEYEEACENWKRENTKERAAAGRRGEGALAESRKMGARWGRVGHDERGEGHGGSQEGRGGVTGGRRGRGVGYVKSWLREEGGVEGDGGSGRGRGRGSEGPQGM